MLRDSDLFDRIWVALIVCVAAAVMGYFVVPRLLQVPGYVILVVFLIAVTVGVVVASVTKNMPVLLVKFALVAVFFLGIIAGMVMNG